MIMSMRNYSIDDYGLILDAETVKAIASKIFDDFDDSVVEDWGYLLYEMGVCEYVSEFTGDAQELLDDGSYIWGGNEYSYDDEAIYYVPLSKYPTLFKKAYNDMGEIIDEFKGKLGECLPEGFDYRDRICHICGTYYG